jgi:hypothetical protein
LIFFIPVKNNTTAKMDAMNRYQYLPLNKKVPEIRLLTLLAGKDADEIHIDIHHALLNQDDPPAFETLSYAWGSQDNPIGIRIVTPEPFSISVSQNLATALPYLRWIFQDPDQVEANIQSGC